jgi:hypothetical protein
MRLPDLTTKSKGMFIAGCICLLLCIGSLILTSRGYNASQEELLTTVKMIMVEKLEQGYAQGQLDASKGTIRIRMVNDSTAVWVSSPWGKVKAFQDTIKNLNILH